MYDTLAAVVVLSLLSHAYFKRNEPQPFQFLGYLAFGSTLSFAGLVGIHKATIFQALLSTILYASLYLAVLSTSIIAYRLSPWHPLAAFPGPKLAVISKWWMVYNVLGKGGRHLTLQKLHNNLGPFVRVGPNELSINHASAVRSVYKLDRAVFYQATPSKGDAVITVLDRQRHATRRQAWARAVTGEAMYSYIPPTQRRIKQFLEIIQQQTSAGKKVILDHWLSLFFMDLMGDMGFSGGFETMKAGEDKDGWIDILGKGVMFTAAMGQLPWLKTIMMLLPQRGPIESFQNFTHDKILEIQKSPKKDMRQDILSTVMDHRPGSTPLTLDEAAADSALIVVAATDTGIQTALSFVRYICVDQEKQRRLQKEIDEVFDQTGELDVKAVMHLPYFDACIQESLRIMPPGPFGPPKTTGETGARILDTWIPPSTTVHVPVFALHRDPANFGPLADTFIPERWLESEITSTLDKQKLLPCNREAFVPFSTGYSSCIGKQLAQQNLKIFLAYLFHAYEILPSSDFNAKEFDASYKEYGLWTHDPFKVKFIPRQ
ncbi:cytochrome P450 [Crucibulum laeve]|uniref:Cytochrome P450 n=1 Tax=Crucibulum laeve TaxID=68775 RepID=A0A5C3LMN1_9AGAR|nr:cytochrome P450 [Crucibulum laeve]